jgi:hypothetical protein
MSATRKLWHFATPALDSVLRPRSTGPRSIVDRTRNVPCPGIEPSLALPQAWRTDGGHRTSHRCSRKLCTVPRTLVRSARFLIRSYFALSSKPSFNY